MEISKVNDVEFEIKKDEKEGMNTNVTVYATEHMLDKMKKDKTLQQARNAATLPKIIGNVLVMPDGHEGYGFPVGGVVAFDSEDGIVSPGINGFDINCLHPDTQIALTDKSFKKIADIVIGDTVLTFDRKTESIIPTKVIIIMKRQEALSILKISTKSGKSILATKDHPILTDSGMKNAEDLTGHDFVVIYDIESEKNKNVEIKMATTANVGTTLYKSGKLKSYYSNQNITMDKISNIIEIPYMGYVYDFTIDNPNHNFIANGIVVSNCGMRLIKTNLTEKELRPKLGKLMDSLFANVPSGVGSKFKAGFTPSDLEKIAEEGVDYAIKKGFGFKNDAERIEENGHIAGADYSKVSDLAKKRGKEGLGTLGAGNHFLEVQRIDKIFNKEIAKTYGLYEDQVVVMVHTGSRGFGHQICSDYLRIFAEYQMKNNIKLVDPELSYAALGSKEADSYLGAMRCAINFAFSNRQVITDSIRKSFEQTFEKSADALGMEILYDIAHNIIKFEEHVVYGKRMKLCVHRKGATRAFAKGRKEVPKMYRDAGQPVIIPGSMGTASYILAGAEGAMEKTFGSACHGSGRVMSRHQAIREIPASRTFGDMEKKNIEIRVKTRKLISEEAEWAYKDVDEVVGVVDKANIANIISRNVPLGVAKG